MKHWEIDLLQDVDYYKRVLMDGCVVKNKDVEICDLRIFVDKYRGSERPVIQVYKANKGDKEYCQTFHNFGQAVTTFQEMSGLI